MDEQGIKRLVVERFIELFQGRQDIFAIQLQDGRYKPIEAPYSTNVIVEHLAGKRTIGIYLIRDDKVKFTCIDLDEKDREKVDKIKQAISDVGISSNEYLIEFSGNKGYHFWIFYSDWVKAKYAQALGRTITAKAGMDSLEVFPKQDHVDSRYKDDNGKLNAGSLIKLPLGIHQFSKQRSEAVDNDLKTKTTRLLEVRPITEDNLVSILKKNYQVYENKRVEIMTSTINTRAYPCFTKMQFGTDKGDRDEVAFRLAVHCYRNGIEQDLAYKLLQNWNERNNPPLDDYTIKRKIKSAYDSKRTGFGCEKPFMQKYCSDKCRLKKTKKKIQDINIFIPPNGFVRDFVEFATECTDAPIQFHLMSAFVILSTICGGDLWIEFGNEKIKPNIWAVIVAPSSSFHKTSSLNIARNIIATFDPRLIYPKEFTGERLIEIMSVKNQGIFFFSELTSFLGQLNKTYMLGTKETLTDLFDCKEDPSPQRSTKGGGDIYIKNPYIVMYAATTLSWATSKISEEDILEGFIPRWLIMPAVRKTLHYGIPPKMDKLKRNNVVRQLMGIGSLSGEVDVERIRDRYEEWSEELTKRIGLLSPTVQPFLSRYETYALKIALLYEISYNNRVPVSISLESLEYAISFMEFMFNEVKEIIETKMVFSQFEKDRQRIFEIIDKTGIISRSSLIRYAHMPSAKLDDVINTLKGEGTIEEENTQGGGPLLYKMREID